MTEYATFKEALDNSKEGEYIRKSKNGFEPFKPVDETAQKKEETQQIDLSSTKGLKKYYLNEHFRHQNFLKSLIEQTFNSGQYQTCLDAVKSRHYQVESLFEELAKVFDAKET